MIDLDAALARMLAAVAPRADFDSRLQARLDALRQPQAAMDRETARRQAQNAYQFARAQQSRQLRTAILAAVTFGLAAVIVVLVIDADWRRVAAAMSSGVALLRATDLSMPFATLTTLAAVVLAARPDWWSTARAALLE